MGKKHYTPEQILIKLREVEVMQSKGQTMAEACDLTPSKRSKLKFGIFGF